MTKRWIDNQGNEFDRATGLGASEKAAVLGYHPHTTPYEIWALKTGRLDPKEVNAAMLAGTRHQPTVLQYYNDTPGRDARMFDIPVTYRQADPRLWSTPDAIDYTAGRLIEIKCTEVWNKAEWDGDTVPDHHRIQANIQAYAMEECMHFAPAPITLAVLIGLSDYREYEVAYDRAWAEDSIAYAIDWWQRHVVADVPPEVTPRDIETFRRLHPDNTGEVIEADEELAEMIQQLASVRHDLATARRNEAELKRKIEARVQDATYVRTGAGALRMGWKERKGYDVKPTRYREFTILNDETTRKELGDE